MNQGQQRELLTYHRAKKDREAICPDCSKFTREHEQQCYWCDNTFSDEHGVVGRASTPEEMRALKTALGVGDGASEEDKEAAVIGMIEKQRAAGIHILEGPISQEEWDSTYKAKWKASQPK